ncbi:hypothetical protein L7F22_041103 [Adiantum nelumboides]|nr:hypothetical protein [Adiantum nelumboides]
MVSSETYQFVSEDVSSGAQVKTIDRGYLSLPFMLSTKAANWENLNELELLNSAGGTLQEAQLLSSARMSFSNGLGGLSVSHMDGREGQMGAYFPGSDVQGEAIQTLHRMNPPYSGYAGTASNTDNMIFVHPSAASVRHINFLDHPSQLQQQYFGFSSSSSFTQSSVSHHSPVSSVYNASMVPQSSSQQTSLFSNRIRSNTWAAQSEQPFLPVNDTAQLTQPLAARLACMEPGQQQLRSSLSHLVSRPNQGAHEDHGSMLRHDIALGLTTDNPQASPGSSQGLSLSLSAQHNSLQLQCFGLQPGAATLSPCQGLALEDGSRDNQYSHRWVGYSDQLKASSNRNHLASAYQFSGLDSSNRELPLEATVQPVPGFRGYLTGSKYLRVAQFLLEEVVSLGCGLKFSSSKQMKLQSWIGVGALLDSSSSKDENTASGTLTNPKEGVACVVSTTQKTLISSDPEQKAITERNMQDNQELQLKKAKLVAMLDEVDRRYKLYFSQMEAVVNTFESAAGLGAAKTYTALALQTISKHFRGLRDAIGSQIRAASRTLGEDDSSSLGLGRLRYVDQQLRQQRALQQLGMMQQHAWRPQRGLPERSVSVLRAWLFEHFLHPYPKDADKHMLARQTGLSRNQVSNWFINARVRLWKPMVEEMYLEELKEAEVDRTTAEISADQKSNTETSDNHRSGISCMDDQAGVGVPDSNNTHGRDEVGSQDLGVMQSDKQVVPNYQPASSSALSHASGLDCGEAHLLQGILKGGVSIPLEQGLKPEDVSREEEYEGHSRHSFRARGLEHYAYGGYYDQGEGFSAVPAGYNGVSLTLGLHHSDGVSLASAQQQFYVQQQQNHLQDQGFGGSLFSQLAMTGTRRRLDEVEEYYSCLDSSKNYEALGEMQTRKRFASNMYNQG